MRSFRLTLLLPVLALLWLVTTGSMCPGGGPTEPGEEPNGRLTDVGGYMEIRPAAPGPEDLIRLRVPALVKSGNPSGYAAWSIAVYRGTTDETAQSFQPGANNLVRLINMDDTLRAGETFSERTIQLPVGGYTIGFYLSGSSTAGTRHRAVYRRLNITTCDPLRIVGFPDTLTLGAGPTSTFRNLPDTGNLLNPEPIDAGSIPEARIGEEFVFSSFFIGGKVFSGPNTFVRQFELIDVAPELGLDIVNNEIRGIPAEGSGGNHWVLVRVSDECGGRTPPGAGPLPGPTGPAYPRWITVRWPIKVFSSLCPPVVMGPASLPVAILGEPYSVTFAPTGGTPPFTYEAFASFGILPPGLALTSTGLAGPLTQAGEFDFSIEVTDACAIGSPRTNRKGYRLTVIDPADCPEISLRAATLPPGEVGEEYGWDFFSGGFPPVSVVVTGGSLPPGLTIDTSSGLGGSLPGLPTTAGEFSFTLEMTDSCTPPQIASRTFTVTIDEAPSCDALALVATPFPNGDLGVAYNQLIDVTGGVDPLVFTVPSGSLPPGLSINSATKRVAGTPTVAGTFNFTIRVSDSCAEGTQVAEQPYSIVIDGEGCAPPPMFTITGLPPGDVGAAYDVTLPVSNGEFPLIFELLSGDLPPGLNLTAAGAVSGTPTTAGTFVFEASVRDSCVPPRTDTESGITITIEGPSTCPPIEAEQPVLEDATVGQFFSQGFEASGGEGNIQFSASFGTGIPPGMTLDMDTGILSGTPTAAGTYQWLLSIFDECDPPQNRQFAVDFTVNDP